MQLYNASKLTYYIIIKNTRSKNYKPWHGKISKPTMTDSIKNQYNLKQVQSKHAHAHNGAAYSYSH